MDFLDPKRQKRSKIQLIVGYVLLTIVVGLTTLVLVFVAEGYGFGKNGQIIQNGFVFVSSTPNPANIYLNGKLTASTTNARLQLPAGEYTLKLTRTGYRPWQRSLGVEGGSTEHFDYPFLFPNKLVTTNLKSYNVQPSLLTQSPSRQWLLISDPSNFGSFTEYDMSNSNQPVVSKISLPSSIFTNSSGAQSWKLVEWSTDNQHVLLEHIFSGGSEYILMDRQTPANSVNLTKALKLGNNQQVSLYNKEYDHYYIYNSAAQTLSTIALDSPQTSQTVLNDVLAYKTYSTDVILYATTQGASKGNVYFDVWQSGDNYQIQQEPTSSNYDLNITQYQGDWYAAFGTSSDGKIYIYENPMVQSQAGGQPQVPIYILKINNPSLLQFSANAQFIAAENGDNFSVYDIFNQKGYSYKVNLPLGASETAEWMDGNRLVLISGGKIVVFDYDGANQQTLESAINGYGPLFDPAYKYAYAVAPTQQKTSPYALTSTPLRIPADL